MQFFNIVCLVLVIASNIFYFVNGEHEDWIEDEVSSGKVEKMHKGNDIGKWEILFESELEECYDDYALNEKKIKKSPSKVYKFTPILFIILFFVNWVLIARLSRRKRLEISD